MNLSFAYLLWVHLLMAVSVAGGSVLFQFSVIGRRYSAAFFPYIGR